MQPFWLITPVAVLLIGGVSALATRAPSLLAGVGSAVASARARC